MAAEGPQGGTVHRIEPWWITENREGTMTETKKAPRKPSGVKSESAGEAAQIRKLAALVAELTARVDSLERASIALSRGNLEVAQEELGTHL